MSSIRRRRFGPHGRSKPYSGHGHETGRLGEGGPVAADPRIKEISVGKWDGTDVEILSMLEQHRSEIEAAMKDGRPTRIHDLLTTILRSPLGKWPRFCGSRSEKRGTPPQICPERTDCPWLGRTAKGRSTQSCFKRYNWMDGKSFWRGPTRWQSQ